MGLGFNKLKQGYVHHLHLLPSIQAVFLSLPMIYIFHDHGKGTISPTAKSLWSFMLTEWLPPVCLQLWNCGRETVGRNHITCGKVVNEGRAKPLPHSWFIKPPETTWSSGKVALRKFLSNISIPTKRNQIGRRTTIPCRSPDRVTS